MIWMRGALLVALAAMTGCQVQSPAETGAVDDAQSVEQALDLCTRPVNGVCSALGSDICPSDTTCCRPAGMNCFTDPKGNTVICPAGKFRCGMVCTLMQDCTTATDPGAAGCNQLYGFNAGLCQRLDGHADCYDTTKETCLGNGTLCTTGVNCPGDPGDPNGTSGSSMPRLRRPPQSMTRAHDTSSTAARVSEFTSCGVPKRAVDLNSGGLSAARSRDTGIHRSTLLQSTEGRQGDGDGRDDFGAGAVGPTAEVVGWRALGRKATGLRECRALRRALPDFGSAVARRSLRCRHGNGEYG